MPVFRLSSIIAALVFVSAPITSFANESVQVTPEEGFWSGGFRSSNGGNIQFSITAVDRIGKLEVNAGNWQGLSAVYRCEYVFAVDGEDASEMYLNEAASFHSNECLPKFPMTLNRISDDVLKATFDAKIGSLIGIPEIELSAGLRPLRDQDRVDLSAPIDIIGLKPGMLRQEISEILEDRGYSVLESIDDAFRGPNYVIAMDRWTKGEVVPEGEQYAGSPRDEISIVFSSTKPWMEQDHRAITIRRGLIPGPSAGLTISAFQRSVQQKYGAVVGDYGGSILYSRQGSIAERASDCGEGTLQALSPTMANLSTRNLSGDSFSFSPYCMGGVNVGLRSDRATGLLQTGTITVGSVDETWQEFWENWSKQEYDQINTVLSALRGGGEGPEL